MAQRPTADYPIDANTTSGTDLSLILNRFQTALESGNSGASRPAYITAGGLWVKEGDPMELYLYDGTTDQLLYDTSNGINVTEGLWTLVDENNEAGEIQRPSDVLIDGNLTVTGDVVDSDGNPISIIDPATEQGVVATWDNTAKQWTPDSAVVVSGGNVEIENGYIKSTRGGKLFYFNPNQALQNTHAAIEADSGMGLMFGDFDNPRMLVLDATGDATFSGDAIVGGLLRAHSGTEQQFTVAASNTGAQLSAYNTAASSYTQLEFRANSYKFSAGGTTASTFVIDSSGDATFSGSVTAANHLAADSNAGAGYGFGGKSRLEVFKDTESAIYGGTQLVATFKSDKNTVFQGNIYKNGTTPVLSTRDLIETLHTLRNATKDEETLEGLRDAIGDAIGGLIQKFEAIQAEAKEKLEEAYNQTGTQEITPDKGTKDDKPEAGTLDLEE